MNRIYRVIWSRALNTWIVASEFATSRGKGSRSRRGAARSVKGSAGVLGRAASLHGAMLLTALAVQSPVHADDRYWDANRTLTGSGGTQTWDLTSTFWSDNGDGVSGPFITWNNAALDNAIFAGTAGTVTLNVPITVHDLLFSANGYALEGGTLTLAGVTPAITVTTGTTTISSVLAGTSGLTKSGGGAIVLNGVNTFTGGITLNQGRIVAETDAALGDASNNIITAAGVNVRLSIAGTVDTARTVTIGDGGTLTIESTRSGSALIMGDGNVSVATNGVRLTNDANSYTGTTQFSGCNGVCSSYFSSIADLGVQSSLGAPTTIENGTVRFNQTSQYSDSLIYLGTGNSSNRNWSISGSAAIIRNQGSGTLTLTGDISNSGGTSFSAESADIAVLGTLSGNANVSFSGNAGRTVTLGGANTYTGVTSLGPVTTVAPVLANAGVASSLGAGSTVNLNNLTILSYTGAASASSDRTWLSQGAAAIRNDGLGALTLSGPLSFVAGGAADALTLGGSYAGTNTVSGVISGVGDLVSDGAGTWVLDAENTFNGRITVQNGTLRAGNALAFGTTTGVTINGGILDLGGFDFELPSLAGSGGILDLGGQTLTLRGSEDSTDYAGNITGSGGLTKLGASVQTLSGANTYTGATTIGGGTLGLNFAAAGGPISDILSGTSILNMGGGNLAVTGAAGENNTQTFNGLNITGGTNNISAVSGAGGSVTLNLGAITRTGGLVDFDLPTNGFIATSNTTLGGWATINNGSNYAKVVGGHITAFEATDYTVQDDPTLWADDQIITDDATGFGTGAVSSPDGTLQLGGLRYTAAQATTVNIAGGTTLGVDGNILVAPSVLANNQLITGGSLTGPLGGGALGIQQNSTGIFTIASQIVDNGGDTVGFTKAGTGRVVLSNANNTYTGPTVISQGTLTVGNIANGGVASSIGASAADPSNLVIEAGTLSYTGATATTDRGFTIVRGGPDASEIQVTNGATNLTFTGQVTSPDDADLEKTGAGTLTLANAANNYTGATIVSGGTLSVNTLANGGVASGIGMSSNASSKLVLGGGTLQYTGGDVSSDRGFTLGPGVGGIDVSSPGTTLTLSGDAVGAGALRKDGAGTLVLSGTNTYAGTTTIASGTLRAGSTQAFGGAAPMVVASGATLDLAGFDNTVGVLSNSGAAGGNVTLGSATLTVQGNNGTFSGAISGSGGLIKGAGGTQTISGCGNSYTGATTINAGTLSVSCLADGGSNSDIGASTNDSANLVLGAGTLAYTGATVSIDRGMTLLAGTNGTINVSDAATTLGLEGQITGPAGFIKNGAGTLVLSGSNDYTGSTTISAGTLRAGSTSAFGVGGGISLGNAAGATLDLDNLSNTVAFLLGGGPAGGNVSLGTGTLTLNAGSTARIYSGAVSGTGGLIKSGAYMQTLDGCNSSYTGSTAVTAGVLAVGCLGDGGANSSIGASDAAPENLLVSGATLRYIGAGDSTNRQFTLGAAATSALDASGTGAIQFTNAAPIVLQGATARTLALRGTSTNDNSLAAQITNASVGATSVTKTDIGTWILTNPNNTYTGVTTISGGVLGVSKLADGGQASSIGASSNVAASLVVGNGSTLRYTGSGDTTDRRFTLAQGVTFIESSGTGAVGFANTAPVTLQGTGARTIALGGTNTGDNTMGGTIADASVSGRTTLAKNDSGTWVLTGNNTYTGNTVVNDGNLVIGDGGTTGNAGAGNVIVDSATSTLSINRGDTFDFSGTLSGPGTLAQIGTGTTRLTSVGNSIGATTVSAGTLEVDGALVTSSIGMSGTSTLNVDGTVQGDTGGAAAFTGDGGASTINVNTGGTLRANGSLGGGNDVLNLAGALDTGSAALSLGDGDDTFTFSDGATISGAGIDAGASVNGDTLQVNRSTNITLDGSNITGFDRLVKQNVAVLTVTGNQAFSAGTEIENGTLDVDGVLQTPAVAMFDGTTLNIDGTVEAAGSAPALLSGSSGSNTVLVNAGATLSANGDLGDGSDSVTLAGALNTGAGQLSLGAGDDTLTLNDGAVISGAGVDASTGSDLLVVNNSAALTFDGGMTAGFESLTKQNTGVATMTGGQAFTVGTSINGGGLDVEGTLETPAITMADGTALTVDGTVQAAGAAQATITGSAGVNTIVVNTGGNLLASGNLGDGSDVVTLSGVLDTGVGVLALGDGNDTLTLNDGAVIDGAGIDGGAATGNDTLVLNNATGLTVNGSTVAGFESLVKQNGGTATLTGTQAFDAGATIDGGALDVDGSLETPTIALADGTTLSVDGTVQAAGATQTAITGSPGVNTVIVNAGGVLLASGDLGNGSDVLDVGGTLDIGGGNFDLGDGDDVFVVRDGTNVIGTVVGGAGFDTRVYDITGAASVGAFQEFEGLTKRNTGTLNITGPGATDLLEVAVEGGTLNVAVAGNITGVQTTSVDAGATLNVDGAYSGSTGDDIFTVAGTVSGAGSIDLGNGDDVLTLRDGAILTAAIDGGGAVGGDRVVLDNASALTFDGNNVSGFEELAKQNTGTATLANSHSYQSTTIDGGTLDVDGTLETNTIALADGVTLSVEGTAQAAGAAQTVITGTAGVNTVVVNAGGALLATGDLGDGNDVLDVAGTLDTGGGVFSLGAGDDTFVVHDTTTVLGTLDAGDGNDLLNVNVSDASTVQLGSTTGFESLGKSGLGELEIAGASDFTDVVIQAGTLDVAGSGSIQAHTTTVSSGATLNVDGALQFTAGADDFTVGGTVTGAGTIDMLDGDDQLRLLDGADLSGLATPIDGGAGNDSLTADIATVATLGGATGFETLTKQGNGALNIAGPVNSSFPTVLVEGGLLDVAAAANVTDVSATTVAAGATLNVDGTYSGTTGADTFTVAGTVTGAGAIDLGDGDDVLTLHDGAVVNAAIDGGGAVGVDRLVLDYASDGVFGGANVSGFEELTKQNTGTATLENAHSYQSTGVEGGTLAIAGSLETPTITLTDDTTLSVDGTVQAAGATQTAISGSSGVNTVIVNASGILLASGDLGDGNDVLDVGGTLDIGGGNFNLGDGDDIFIIRDGTNVVGTVVGGAGFDSRVYDITDTASVGALQEFEGLTKRNTGTLNLTGPGTTDLVEVAVEGGTLNVGAAGAIAGVQTTTVDAGATLNVDGAYNGSMGNDTFTVAGTVSGGGTIDLGDGDDILTLEDGAVLNAAINGGGAAGNDRVVLDNASALAFDGSNVTGFEELAKQNVGTATLTNAHSYQSTALDGGTLGIDGTLDTNAIALADGTTLNVGGTVQAAGATQTTISGTAGVNTVIVDAGGMLLADGDLGDGNDVLDVAGTLDIGGGTFSLGDGDDTFVVRDGTNIVGTVDGGAGIDTRVYDINLAADLGALTGFEGLTKAGIGVLNVHGPGASNLAEVEVLGGTLNVEDSAAINGIERATVETGATLNIDGAFQFTAGADSFTIAGNVTGAGSIDMLDGDDQLTLLDGADLSGLAAAIDGGAGTDTLTASITTQATLGGATGFETLIKQGVGVFTIAGPASSMFDTVLVQQGELQVTAGAVVDPQTTVVDAGATLTVDGTYNGTPDADTFTLSGTLAGAGTIDLLDDNDVLTINNGAAVTFTGLFDASAGTDRFVLAGDSGTDSFDAGLIDTVFQNFEEFRKEGEGTWRVTGAGAQSWTVAGGTLIGDSMSLAGSILNDATVVFDQAVSGEHGGVLSGTGNLIKENTGTLVVTAENTFTGSTQVAAGTLQVDGVLPGTMTIASGATLSGTGTVGSVSALAGGFVAPGHAANPFGTLTIAGDYAGGGTVRINTELGDESSATSRLVIQGNTSGTSPVFVSAAGGSGARTEGDGISIIQVDGTSPADSFRLAQPVEAGAYEYLLYQGGSSDANDWYLRSELIDPQSPSNPDPQDPGPAFRAGVPGYVLGHQANLEYGFAALGNLRARVGDLGRLSDAASRGSPNAWLRVYGHELNLAGTRFEARDLHMGTLQFGTDVHASEAGNASAHLGVMASVGESSATFFDNARAAAGLPTRSGSVDTNAKGAGVYWTRLSGGQYFDLSAQFLHYQNRYRDSSLSQSRQDGWSGTVSAEVGHAFAMGKRGWSLEPQLQLAYQRLELKDFADNISTVSDVKDDALRGRAALQLFRAPTEWLGMSAASPYLALGVQRDFRDAAPVTVAGTTIGEEIPATTGDVSLGFTGSVRTGVELHLDVRYQHSVDGDEKDGVRANFGFRMTF